MDLNNDGRPDLEQIIEEIAKRVLDRILSEPQVPTPLMELDSDHTTNNT